MSLHHYCSNCCHYTEKPTPAQQVKTYIWGCKVLMQGVVPDSEQCPRFRMTRNPFRLLMAKLEQRLNGKGAR